MGRSRKKRTQTDTLFDEAMTQFNGENPATEAEMQTTVDRLRAEGKMPSRSILKRSSSRLR
jgi:hypothetical protein